MGVFVDVSVLGQPSSAKSTFPRRIPDGSHPAYFEKGFVFLVNSVPTDANDVILSATVRDRTSKDRVLGKVDIGIRDVIGMPGMESPLREYSLDKNGSGGTIALAIQARSLVRARK